ncbi:MAG: glycosyltransferase [Faecalibacterium sp.]
MKILMINKFLYPNGGSETYMFGLGQQLEKMGHEVQYFGMEHEGRCVGNRVGAYTSSMDFHGGSRLAKLTYPLKTIYSSEARQKLRLVLDDFRPDVIHLNNFNYQLTPSVLLEADKWRRESGQPCRILYTAHDHQLVCPDHLCYQGIEGHPCEECLGGHYVNCIKHRCIHGSRARSIIGCAEATFWKWKKVYRKAGRHHLLFGIFEKEAGYQP